MHNDSRIETREIADGDLDNVSGGLLGQLVQTVQSAEAALPTVTLPQLTGGANVQLGGPLPVQLGLTGSTGM